MFVFRKANEFKWPVRIPVPEDRRAVTREVTGIFKTVPPERVQQIVRQAIADFGAAADTDGEALQANADLRLLREVLVGWDGIVDEDKQPLAFADETREALLAVPYVRGAFVDAYNQGANGGAKAKN